MLRWGERWGLLFFCDAARDTRACMRHKKKVEQQRRHARDVLTVGLYAISSDLDFREISFRYDDGLERWSGYMTFVESDVDPIVTRFGWQISNGTRAIAIVTTINRSFARTLDGDPKTTLTSATCVYHEFRWPAHKSTMQTRTGSSHLGRITSMNTIQTIRLRRYRFTTKRYSKKILAELRRRKIHQITIVTRHYLRLYPITRWCRYRHLKIRRFSRILRYHPELLQAVHRCRCDDFCTFFSFRNFSVSIYIFSFLLGFSFTKFYRSSDIVVNI